MKARCPGSRALRTPELRLIRCVECGGMIEIFSDERESRCLGCGAVVYGGQNNCALWCPGAETCMGRAARRF